MMLRWLLIWLLAWAVVLFSYAQAATDCALNSPQGRSTCDQFVALDANPTNANAFNVYPNESVTGGSACPNTNALRTQDTDDTAGEAFGFCLNGTQNLTISDSAVRLGGSSNNASFDTTGHLTFSGTGKPWEDVRIEPTSRSGTNAPLFEKWYDDSGDTSRGVYLYSFDDVVDASEDEIFFTLQMPHAWDSGDIDFHVHWVGNVADTTATPRWGLEYIWVEPGGTYGNTTTIYATGNHLSEADITANRHYITAFSNISPGTGADGLSSIMIGRLWRDSSDGADTYNAGTNKCGLLYMDAHYQLNSVGSTDELSK